ncbi:zinc finger HIT domain-containing protein 2 isoform X2 [Rhodamnia argentea]|uniref:Zinc finger HIT domain-containing protein 2 isoform X2 n=1 Tax=Rhodamnia argentea TaxID=178133 RepID=A0A8B8P6B9_9MYRT|nr:zinc finger HIT domain-containing protein 2 isoform X2 [Rhodamnia argentea]
MADAIRSSDDSPAPSPLDPPSRTICHVCQKQFSQYTCPRCNSRYCSLQCYKSHSVRCTESFMRENVVEELRHVQSNDVTKRKMLDILKRLHSEEEEESMDEEDSGLSEEIIEKISSGGQISLDDLSAEEKKRFHRAVASGELSRMIDPWEPWWLKPSAGKIRLSQDGTQLVQPLARKEESGLSEADTDGSCLSDIPPGPETPLLPLSKLSSTPPSPLLAVHLVDIIYSYCFTVRLYNGDCKADALGSLMVILSVSSVLGQSGQPETMLEALSYCLEQTCSPAYRHVGGLKFGMALIDDVVSVLSLGTPSLICLLSDLQRLVQAGEREMKLEKPKRSRRTEVKNKLKLAERKVYFAMCWVHEQPGEAWPALATIVAAEKKAVLVHEDGKRVGKSSDEDIIRGKTLVEEVE